MHLEMQGVELNMLMIINWERLLALSRDRGLAERPRQIRALENNQWYEIQHTVFCIWDGVTLGIIWTGAIGEQPCVKDVGLLVSSSSL